MPVVPSSIWSPCIVTLNACEARLNEIYSSHVQGQGPGVGQGEVTCSCLKEFPFKPHYQSCVRPYTLTGMHTPTHSFVCKSFQDRNRRKQGRRRRMKRSSTQALVPSHTSMSPLTIYASSKVAAINCDSQPAGDNDLSGEYVPPFPARKHAHEPRMYVRTCTLTLKLTHPHPHPHGLRRVCRPRKW